MTDAREWLNAAVVTDPATTVACQNALLAVLDLHAPSSTDDVTVDGDEQWCTECVRDWDGEDWDRVAYPCATVRAINKALADTILGDTDD